MSETDLGMIVQQTAREAEVRTIALSPLSRREFTSAVASAMLAGLFGAHTAASNPAAWAEQSTPGAKNIKRRGADLNTLGSHLGTFRDHRPGIGGLDFYIRDDPDIYPVAGGMVTNKGHGHQYGNFLSVWHGGIYASRYFHLATVPEDMPALGTIVSRKDKIAVGGRTGEGGRSGEHLHLAFNMHSDLAKLIVNMVDIDYDVAKDGYTYFDPVGFAAFKAVDSNGRLTLPYWYGEENDGPLDKSYDGHLAKYDSFFNDKLRRFSSEQTKNLSNSIWLKYGLDGKIGGRVFFLYKRIKSGDTTFGKEEAAGILSAINDFLRTGPRLTAPKKNPDMPELYRH